MVYYRSCRRCQGDRSPVHDIDGYYLICLRCGDVREPSAGLERAVKPHYVGEELPPDAVATSAETNENRLQEFVMSDGE